MGIFLGAMQIKIAGHKELTKDRDIKNFTPNEVAIPLYHLNCNDYELVVKIGDHVNVGTLLGYRKDSIYVPFFASVSGIVKEVKRLMTGSLVQYDHLIIENDRKNTKAEPFNKINVENASRQELIEYMRLAGIVGCGGAGFPSYIKYKANNIETLVINAVECEPYISVDYKNLLKDFDMFAVGLKTAIKMANAKEAVITFKDYKNQNKQEMIEKYQAIDPRVSVKFVKDEYPLGWERTLIYALYKKRYNKLPSELGYLINNASTIIAFGEALINGHGITHKLLTVAGDGVLENCNVRVPVGTIVKDIVEFLGGYTSDACFLIAGGPMMGKTITTDNFAINAYSNALTILKPKKQPPTIACLRCGRCTQFCSAGLQPVKIAQSFTLKDRQAILMYKATDCIECGLCSYVCPSKIEVTENVRRAKRFISEV